MPVGVLCLAAALNAAVASDLLLPGRLIPYSTGPRDESTTLRPVVVRDDFPADRHHGWKFIRFGPDGFLYVPVGAPCNVCERDDPRYASITRMKADARGFEVFARGVRNTVGFDWHPRTRELWFTDNGRDNLGDDVPPDEINRAPAKGLHFGVVDSRRADRVSRDSRPARG